jgi:RNA methyltransferase, TrmH family
MITSPQNPHLKLVRALAGRPRERRAAGAFLAEGVRLVEEAHKSGWKIRFALFSQKVSTRGLELVDSLHSGAIPVEEVDAALLESASETETTQGLLAVCELDSPLKLPAQPNLLLIPDQVRDPGNLGTLIRSAAAFGVQGILLPPNSGDAFAPKVVRAGMGAHFRVPILSMNWDEIRVTCAGLYPVLAEMTEGRPSWRSNLGQPLALIVGGEAEGASEEARMWAKDSVHIPMPGESDSLNAGVAGSILLYEVLRQRKKTN